MASVERDPVVCLGCGESVQRSSERRKLASSSSSHVVPLWKKTMSSQLLKHNLHADLDQLLAGSRRTAGQMCRKCFYSYEKVLTSTSALENNAEKAIAQLCDVQEIRTNTDVTATPRAYDVPPAPKRLPPPARFDPLSSEKQASPGVAINVGYKKPRNFILTPSRKHMGKALARGKRKSVAAECIKDPVAKKYIIKKIGVLLRKGMNVMCSDDTNSMLRQQCISAEKDFSWESFLTELETNAPLLFTILHECTHTRRQRLNQDAAMGMCAAILLKHRFSRMSLVQRINSLVLYSGSSGKQVYDRLQKVNVTMSHKSTIRMLTRLGADHDKKAKDWRSLLIGSLSTAPLQPYLATEALSVISDDSSSYSTSSSDDDSSSICSLDVSASSVISLSDLSEIESETESESDMECDEMDVSSPSNSDHDTMSHETSVCTNQQSLSFKLVGDNLDKNVKARYMCVGGSHNQSYHFFHSFAVLDRIDFSTLPDVHPHLCLNSPKKRALAILPSIDDDTTLRKFFVTHVSRVLVKHMAFFKLTFEDVVEWHIRHQYYTEMSAKSEVVPLGVIHKNENKGDDMVDIMSYLHQYVPAVEYTQSVFIPDTNESVQVQQAAFHQILFGGDQLTAARGRGAKRLRMNSISPLARLDGLIPCAEDWHTKLNLLSVIWKYFYSKKSAGDHGTLYQLRNLLHRTNVVSDPVKDFNACDDFIKLITTCLILAASLEFLGMDSLDAIPSPNVIPDPHSVLAEAPPRRKDILSDICGKIVDASIHFKFNKQGSNNTTDQQVTRGRACASKQSDKIQEYSKQLLSLGCFYLEYSDAIQEGDGTQVLRCWRYLLPIFKSSGRIELLL